MIHLHVHDCRGSLLDSILKVEEIVNFAKQNQQKAIAITNHGAMYSYVDFFKACLKKNIKPILGNEIYEVDDMTQKNDTKDCKQRRYHLILLARNQKGLQNLYKITSDSYTLGFYVKPRVDLDYIQKNKLGEGIVCLTACQAGRVSRYLAEGREGEAQGYVKQLQDTFDYVALEIQSHDTEDETQSNARILDFAKKYNFPYAVTTDAHMLKKEQQDTHGIFVEIGEGREAGEFYTDCFLQTENQVHEILDKHIGRNVVSQAIYETQKIADMVELVDIGLNNGNLMPEIENPKGFNSNEEYLKFLIYRDFNKKFGHLSEEEQQKRKDRIEFEFPILKALDYIDYFIMLYLLARESKKRGIPLGYSRGSGANSLCLYMLNVTQIDSVKWDLDFSRFANLGRKSVADFDMDISKRRRKEMVAVSRTLFGKDKVAPICTFNNLSTKVAIRDVGKVLHKKEIYDIPYKVRDEVSKMIPTIKTINDLGEEEEKEILLRDVLFKNEKLKEINEKFPLWFKYVLEIEGLPKSLGKHPCGTIIAPQRLVSYCPLCLDNEGEVMLQLEMHNAMDDIGLCKMDFLGLESLDTIDDALKMIGLTWDDFDINRIDLEDKAVYESIYKNGNTVGVFQMESAEAIKMCVEAKVDNIEDVISINASNRPATKDFFPTYCKNKAFPNEVEVIHSDLLKILNKSHFILLYQEQALQLFRHAGFPEEEVDLARRAIGKKERETMEKMKDRFILGLLEKNWTKKQAVDVWDMLEKQSTYSFNRGHATAYSLLSYLMAYLKYHYPLEFMTSCLISKTNNVSRLSILISECNRLGIKVLPPHINRSGEGFTAIKEANQILFGILPIKGVGETAVKAILANRPFRNLKDFIERAKSIKEIDRAVVIALIKAGALPTKNKRELLLTYAESTFEMPEYKPYKATKSLPTLLELETKWNIDTKAIKTKDERLELYNERRKIYHDTIKKQEWGQAQNTKRQKLSVEFEEKYMKDEYLWEFETLSMFLSNNPFQGAYEKIVGFHRTEDGNKCVCVCVIIDIKRKKDKNGNAFAYLDLYTPDGIIESICWSSKYAKYQELVKKGNSIAILGRKNEDKLFVEEMKSYQQWQDDNGFDFFKINS